MNTSGRPLDGDTRGYFEQRFGEDFSAVRIHTDSQAAKSAHSINADAYTVGDHITFGAEKYRPDTTEGRRLLAHELTHVAQQSAISGLARRPTELGTAGDSAEREAEHNAASLESKAPIRVTPTSLALARYGPSGPPERESDAGATTSGATQQQTPSGPVPPAGTSIAAPPGATTGCDFQLNGIDGPTRILRGRMNPTATDPNERAQANSCGSERYRLRTTQTDTEILHIMWRKTPPPVGLSVERTAKDDGATRQPAKRRPERLWRAAVGKSRSAPLDAFKCPSG